jgi:hypothetical protein
MNRDQIIVKTLEEMHLYEGPVEYEEPDGADLAAEYDRDIVIPEMKKRLPDGEITTCAELRLEVECCESCHGYYPHYDMHVVDLPDGRIGWICCAVRRVLFRRQRSQKTTPNFWRSCGRLVATNPTGNADSTYVALRPATS